MKYGDCAKVIAAPLKHISYNLLVQSQEVKRTCLQCSRVGGIDMTASGFSAEVFAAVIRSMCG